MNNPKYTLEILPRIQYALSYGLIGVCIPIIFAITSRIDLWGRVLFVFGLFSWPVVIVISLFFVVISFNPFIRIYGSLRRTAKLAGIVALLLPLINIVLAGLVFSANR